MPSSRLEWRDSARRLPRLPKELGSGPVRLLPCRRSSWVGQGRVGVAGWRAYAYAYAYA